MAEFKHIVIHQYKTEFCHNTKYWMKASSRQQLSICKLKLLTISIQANFCVRSNSIISRLKWG